MDKKEIKEVISKRLNKIEKHLEKIAENFGDEDIHKFRIEIKKLRAFLRLLPSEPGAKQLSIPKKLKKVYAETGVVRDVTLHLNRIHTVTTQDGIEPKSYIKLRAKEMEKSRKKLKGLLTELDFTSIRKKLSIRLPEVIDQEYIEQFKLGKFQTIASLVNARKNDESLHTIRKNLKDLLYNAKLLNRNDKQEAGEVLLDKNQLTSIEQKTQDLGEYMDISFALKFISPHYLDKVSVEEKKQLQQVIRLWSQEKKERRTAVLQSLKLPATGENNV